MGPTPHAPAAIWGVRYVLQGNVQKVGTRWRVSIQLFDGKTQRAILSDKHDFALENVFASLRACLARVGAKRRVSLDNREVVCLVTSSIAYGFVEYSNSTC